MSTRTKNNARAMRKVVESKITDSIEGGENIEETFEATGMAMKPLKSIAKEVIELEKGKSFKTSKRGHRKQGEKEND